MPERYLYDYVVDICFGLEDLKCLFNIEFFSKCLLALSRSSNFK